MWLCHDSNLDVLVYKDEERFSFEVEKVIKKEDLDPKLYVLDFGKYQGMNLIQVYAEDAKYVEWLRENGKCLLLTQCIENI